ncbi:hypothetical protein D9611_014121 [Ephemerocybe angulata]|uniref:Uncharacterized protein n=1 Tax=Ephemerocybe angulata TaxID=980116 RepID=A0A8H5B9D8_9AGAR|nr:hypothetical protein D9611_014121 [Tulosesus angulatus]
MEVSRLNLPAPIPLSWEGAHDESRYGADYTTTTTTTAVMPALLSSPRSRSLAVDATLPLDPSFVDIGHPGTHRSPPVPPKQVSLSSSSASSSSTTAAATFTGTAHSKLRSTSTATPVPITYPHAPRSSSRSRTPHHRSTKSHDTGDVPDDLLLGLLKEFRAAKKREKEGLGTGSVSLSQGVKSLLRPRTPHGIDPIERAKTPMSIDHDSSPPRKGRERSSSSASSRPFTSKTAGSSNSESFVLLLNQLKQETKRADATETQLRELAERYRLLRQEKVSVDGQLAVVREELGLYKVQLDLAQREILRAQEIVNNVDRQRVEAETNAERNRARVRKLMQEQLVAQALEDGRREGFAEGVRRGREVVEERDRARRERERSERIERERREREEEEEQDRLEWERRKRERKEQERREHERREQEAHERREREWAEHERRERERLERERLEHERREQEQRERMEKERELASRRTRARSNTVGAPSVTQSTTTKISPAQEIAKNTRARARADSVPGPMATTIRQPLPSGWPVPPQRPQSTQPRQQPPPVPHTTQVPPLSSRSRTPGPAPAPRSHPPPVPPLPRPAVPPQQSERKASTSTNGSGSSGSTRPKPMARPKDVNLSMLNTTLTNGRPYVPMPPPPDNYIPMMDVNGSVHVPPPFEFRSSSHGSGAPPPPSRSYPGAANSQIRNHQQPPQQQQNRRDPISHRSYHVREPEFDERGGHGYEYADPEKERRRQRIVESTGAGPDQTPTPRPGSAVPQHRGQETQGSGWGYRPPTRNGRMDKGKGKEPLRGWGQSVERPATADPTGDDGFPWHAPASTVEEPDLPLDTSSTLPEPRSVPGHPNPSRMYTSTPRKAKTPSPPSGRTSRASSMWLIPPDYTFSGGDPNGNSTPNLVRSLTSGTTPEIGVEPPSRSPTSMGEESGAMDSGLLTPAGGPPPSRTPQQPQQAERPDPVPGSYTYQAPVYGRPGSPVTSPDDDTNSHYQYYSPTSRPSEIPPVIPSAPDYWQERNEWVPPPPVPLSPIPGANGAKPVERIIGPEPVQHILGLNLGAMASPGKGDGDDGKYDSYVSPAPLNRPISLFSDSDG